MFVFGELAQRISKIVVNDIVKKAVEENEAEIVNMNTEDQIFDKGIKADGSKIKRKGANYPVYSKPYEKKKKKLGLYQGYVDLSLKGKYLNNYRILTFSDYFLIMAKEMILKRGFDLSGHLREYYGNNIEGLTEKNIERIPSIISTDFAQLFLTQFRNV